MGDKDTKAKKGKKAKRTPEQKRRSGAIAIVTCLSLLVALAIILSSFSAASQVSVETLMNREYDKVAYAAGTQLKPVQEFNPDGSFYWTFKLPRDDYDFKVLQLTDVHIGGGFASTNNDIWAMNAVANMINVEKPDLVVVTGDIAYPVPFQAGTFNNLNATKIFSRFMTRLGVYWTFTFGNHDTEVYGTHTREDIISYYADQIEKNENGFGEYCLFNPQLSYKNEKGTTLHVDGFSNQMIKIKNTKGITTQVVSCIDSHSYHEDDRLGILWHYDSIHENQQQWFCDEMDRMNKDNRAIDAAAEDIFGSLYIHIPLEEYREAYAVAGNTNNYEKGKTYGEAGQRQVTIEGGIIGEKDPYCYSGTYGCTTFEKCAPHGLKAVFCGHDHYNNIIMNYTKNVEVNGEEKPFTVKLCYGRSIDYLAYPGIWQWQAQRGCNRILLQGNNIKVENQDYYSSQYEAERNKPNRGDKATKYNKQGDAIPERN